MFRLCWKQDAEIKKRQFNSMEDIFNMMSNCIWSGEWVETKTGERVSVNWEEICHHNLSLF